MPLIPILRNFEQTETSRSVKSRLSLLFGGLWKLLFSFLRERQFPLLKNIKYELFGTLKFMVYKLKVSINLNI